MSSSSADLARRYTLGEPLGAGGQGRTYRALDNQTGQAVAVKVIRLGDGGWKSFDLFERECRVLQSLRHPAIPKYLDTFAVEEAGRYFLVMELVQGTPLHQIILRGELLPEAQLWSLCHQALDVLDYLHGLHPPVIHRDLKPANFIRRGDGRLALVDFGGVRVALRPDGGSTMIGSFGYMAPEQLHGEAIPATDLYGLGATLCALAAGMEADKLPRRGLRVDLPAVMADSPLRRLLEHLLEPDPTARPASVEAVRALLRDGDAGGGEPSSADEREDPPRGAAALVRLFGTLGYAGLMLLEAMALPLVYLILSHVWSRHPERVRRLQARREQARAALRSGRRSMGQLARGQRHQRRSLLPPSSPPALPEGRRRGRRRHGRS